MTKRKMRILFCLMLTVFSTELKAQEPAGRLEKLSDAPDDAVNTPFDASNPITYETVLQQWRTVSEVNSWIKNNYRYSIERAKQLAENSSERENTGIYSPAELYQIKKGVCIDLSRFAVETINLIDTSKHVQYLMIEFEPIMIDSSIMRQHWMAVYQDASGYHILADSKRPGHIAGPYKNMDDFIAEYQTFRERKIVSRKVLLSYEKRKKQKAMRQKRKS